MHIVFLSLPRGFKLEMPKIASCSELSYIPAAPSVLLPGTAAHVPQTMTVPVDDNGDIIHLNVGGHVFCTSRATLRTGAAHGSMLAILAASNGLPSLADEHGRLFIDRDGDRFAVVLNYLRCGSLTIIGDRVPCPRVPAGFVILEDVLAEARFFGLCTLANLVQDELDRLALEDALERLHRERWHTTRDSIQNRTTEHRRVEEDDAWKVDLTCSSLNSSCTSPEHHGKEQCETEVREVLSRSCEFRLDEDF